MPNVDDPKAGWPKAGFPKDGFAAAAPNPDWPKPEPGAGAVVDAGALPNAETVGGAGLLNALVVFPAAKAPNPVAGLRRDPPKPEDVCAAGVEAGLAPKEPNMLLDAFGSVGCPPPRPNPPNPPEKVGVESDIDASRVMSVEDSA